MSISFKEISREIVTTSLFGIALLSSFKLAEAKMSYLDYKGVSELILPEFQAQISPISGGILLATDTLKNRRFNGNYGPRTSGHSCMNGTRISQLLEEKQDCPHDYTSEWIQRLFP